MAFTRNHYELLELPINATPEEIKAAYHEKFNAAPNPDMEEKYRTAYYVLSDERRREDYDLSLGIHKYRQVSGFVRVLKAAARVLLTIMDALCTFYWCFLAAVVVMFAGWRVWLWKEQQKAFTLNVLLSYKYEIWLLCGFAAVDLLLHFYVRRANRYLKHYNWEYSVRQHKKRNNMKEK